ncbi:PREDICTED: protein GIGAS CELL1-like [Camelina sativa]|uniref:Protein GIGAS CELL1-like n=1 Tax=Camelina sativa TaxID=90675 RepID=A0ABM0YR83_CAMSA|nr:PREDICTED: protein GIGAS CELL1-like [Camelina sativa]
MPEARDRIERPIDYSVIFANRRSNGVLLDVPDSQLRLIQSPVLRLPSDSPGPGSIGRGSLVRTGGGIGRGNFSTWRPGNGRAGHTPFRLAEERENMPMVAARRGRGRASRSPLPYWYPRTPLRDITHTMRAIERRRAAGMRVDDGRDVEIPTHQQVGVLESPVPVSGEDKCSMETPGPSVGIKRSCPPSTARVHKMLLDITKEIAEEEAGFITPEKKLLNSIDKVEKIVMKEIQKMKCTPQAKREEREKKVRTLMSMR